jgi:hypothetical protein
MGAGANDAPVTHREEHKMIGRISIAVVGLALLCFGLLGGPRRSLGSRW